MNLIKAELFKLRTTSIWWIMAIILVPLYAASLLLIWAGAAQGSGDSKMAPHDAATNLYTVGQYMGVLIVLLLSAIIVTSEFFHLTATTTFLVTPRRQSVILAKFVAAIIVAVIVWLFTTVLDLIFAPILLHSMGYSTYFGDGGVWRAIGLNLLAFVLWSVLGVGAGVLIRSQIAATIVLGILYVIGSTGAALIFAALAHFVAHWFDRLQLLIPTVASDVLITGAQIPGNPPRWLGAVVLIAYAAVTGVIGTVITKRRDIS
jgi:ABC-type transport system involved in multi-copper enzyme maturation permease subunit